MGQAAAAIAVLGGTGFVGSHLCGRLLARGRRVIAVDDFSTGDGARLGHAAIDAKREEECWSG